MNAAHWHLVLNHVPVFLTLPGIIFLLVGLWKQSDEIKGTALVLFVLAGAVVVPVYYSGHEAEEIVEESPAVNEPLLEQHEESAEMTRMILILLGLVSLVGLGWEFTEAAPVWLYGLVLMMSLVGGGYLGYTAYLGGQARHPEIRSSTISTAEQHEDGEHRQETDREPEYREERE